MIHCILTMPSTLQSVNKELLVLMSGTVGDNAHGVSGSFSVVSLVSRTELCNHI